MGKDVTFSSKGGVDKMFSSPVAWKLWSTLRVSVPPRWLSTDGNLGPHVEMWPKEAWRPLLESCHKHLNCCKFSVTLGDHCGTLDQDLGSHS